MGFFDWVMLALVTLIAGQAGFRILSLFVPHIHAVAEAKPTSDGFAVCRHCRKVLPVERVGDGR